MEPLFIFFDEVDLETIQRNLELLEHVNFLCFDLTGEGWPIDNGVLADGALRALPAVTIKIGCSELKQIIFLSVENLLMEGENIGRALFVFQIHERCAAPSEHLDLPAVMLRLASVNYKCQLGIRQPTVSPVPVPIRGGMLLKSPFEACAV